jgi:rsbT co-antagonist protein RsbR
MPADKPSIRVDQVDFSWDLDRGLMMIWGQPVVSIWIESTMAGLMVGIQRMVGTERFNLAMEGAGRESTEGEWQNIIAPMGDVAKGLHFIGQCMRTVGLGEVELRELDLEARRLCFRARNSWEGMYQRALGVNWGTWSLAGKLAAYGERILGVPCQVEQTAFVATGDEHDEFFVTPAAKTYAQRLAEVVDSDTATREDLKRTLAQLRDEISQRQRVEGELRATIEVIHRQEQKLREVTTPILQVWPEIVALPIVGVIDSERVASIMESLLVKITATRARLVIIDLTGADSLDAAAAGNLLQVIRAARLLGARGVLSGISPTMAETLVNTESQLHGIRAYSTLEAALRDGVGSAGKH